MNKKQQQIDVDLVIAYQSGNYHALPKLVKRWHKEFCNTALWVVKDTDIAKDIAQDCWSIIMNKINNLKDARKFKSWALRIVYTKSLDWVKARAREQQQLQKLKSNTINYEEPPDNSSIKQQLLEAVNNLPVHQQQVLKLFYTQDYSLKEISELLYVSEGTVKSRLFHAREKLKAVLKKYKE